MYILRPHAAGISYAPPLFSAPRRVFSGVGGWGCIKFGAVSPFSLFSRGLSSKPLVKACFARYSTNASLSPFSSKRASSWQGTKARFTKSSVFAALKILFFVGFPRNLVAMYRAMRAGDHAAANQTRIRIVRCEQPAKRQKLRPCETKSR